MSDTTSLHRNFNGLKTLKAVIFVLQEIKITKYLHIRVMSYEKSAILNQESSMYPP